MSTYTVKVEDTYSESIQERLPPVEVLLVKTFQTGKRRHVHVATDGKPFIFLTFSWQEV